MNDVPEQNNNQDIFADFIYKYLVEVSKLQLKLKKQEKYDIEVDYNSLKIKIDNDLDKILQDPENSYLKNKKTTIYDEMKLSMLLPNFPIKEDMEYYFTINAFNKLVNIFDELSQEHQKKENKVDNNPDRGNKKRKRSNTGDDIPDKENYGKRRKISQNITEPSNAESVGNHHKSIPSQHPDSDRDSNRKPQPLSKKTISDKKNVVDPLLPHTIPNNRENGLGGKQKEEVKKLDEKASVDLQTENYIEDLLYNTAKYNKTKHSKRIKQDSNDIRSDTDGYTPSQENNSKRLRSSQNGTEQSEKKPVSESSSQRKFTTRLSVTKQPIPTTNVEKIEQGKPKTEVEYIEDIINKATYGKEYKNGKDDAQKAVIEHIATRMSRDFSTEKEAKKYQSDLMKDLQKYDNISLAKLVKNLHNEIRQEYYKKAFIADCFPQKENNNEHQVDYINSKDLNTLSKILINKSQEMKNINHSNKVQAYQDLNKELIQAIQKSSSDNKNQPLELSIKSLVGKYNSDNKDVPKGFARIIKDKSR